MKPYPEVLFRHTDKHKAFHAFIEAHFGGKPGNIALRKAGNHWLILLRSQSTRHVGNKKWRANVRKRRNSRNDIL